MTLTHPVSTADSDPETVPFIHHVIGGARVLQEVERWGAVFDPSTGRQSAAVPLASAADADAAVQDAHRAFLEWSAVTPLRRARVMFRFKELIEAHIDEIARLISTEHGKIFADARGEVQRGLEVVEFCCGIPHLLKGEFTESVGTGIDSWSMRQPLGVGVGITPFNFPVMVPLWMLAPAIACGNTFVIKPSEKDPSSTVRLAELLVEAGAPPGVLNVLQGDKTAVDALISHPLVQAVSFVGSTPIARYIYETCARHGKRVQAMGGAKNHLIVMPDADLDQATDGLIGAAYGSAGERCMAISVAVPVGEATANALVARLAQRVRELRIGPSLSSGIDMGPLVTAAHHERVVSYVDLGVREGADLVVDGRGCTVAGHEGGYFLGGCLFDHVTPAMRIYQEEIFGPVLTVVRARSFDEALGLADDHAFGNGVSIYTRDGDAAREFVSRVQVGMVGVNVPIPVPLAFHSFGGWKQSAFGDMNQHGMEGVRFWTKLKTVTSRWPRGIRAGSEFTMPVMQ
ncbi:MAG: CoA-acylating methylmalonate-semialdehyde dehydrogenase [Gemmatimonadaceae bacterium]|nr:CoA-acylating methylmalonate-semialdehyde dehydrogenase [Gemmatimonadaceae bacterium]